MADVSARKQPLFNQEIIPPNKTSFNSRVASLLSGYLNKRGSMNFFSFLLTSVTVTKDWTADWAPGFSVPGRSCAFLLLKSLTQPHSYSPALGWAKLTPPHLQNQAELGRHWPCPVMNWKLCFHVETGIQDVQLFLYGRELPSTGSIPWKEYH